MQNQINSTRGSRAGFTLVELLVVISIIAVLAGMVMTGVIGMKAKAQVARARTETVAIAAAIQDYIATYGMPPVTQKVWDCSRTGQTSSSRNPDFTYGTATNGVSIKSYGTPAYTADNSEIIAVLRYAGATPALRSLADVLNPKRVPFLEVSSANNDSSPGVGSDGIFRDPWGNPYIISLDLNSDGKTIDGYYANLISKGNRSLNPEINGAVLVWSFGPDGKVQDIAKVSGTFTDIASVLKYGDNKDNILSWDK